MKQIGSTRIFLAVSLALAILPTSSMHASPNMRILYESYRAAGYAWISPFTDIHYSQTGSPPAFGEITRTYDPSGPDEEKTVHVESTAMRYASGGNLYFRAEQDSFCPYHDGEGDFGIPWVEGGAFASVTVDFMLKGAGKSIAINASRDFYTSGRPTYSYAYATLTDLTTGSSWALLGDRAAPDPWDPSPVFEPWTMETSLFMHFHPSHVYRLEAQASQYEWHDSYIEVGFVGVNLARVPVPGAFLLGTLGTGLVGWLRRHRTL